MEKEAKEWIKERKRLEKGGKNTWRGEKKTKK